MIHYNDIKIGDVYSPTKRLNTTDYSHEITTKSCFTIISKDEMNFFDLKRFRFQIIYNDLKQVLLVEAIGKLDNLNSKMLPFKKVV